MDSAILILGGLALFLFGMKLCSRGLEHSRHRKLTGMLQTMTSSPIRGTTLGLIMTLFTQSSSATGVILVSLVQSSMLTMAATLPVLLGAGIGTSITVQLIAFRIFRYSLLFVAAGVITLYVSKQRKFHIAGEIVLGFGLIFYGMQVMSTGLAPLLEHPALMNLLAASRNYPWAALGIATLATIVVQASAAIIAILISLSIAGIAGAVDGAELLASMMPMVFGANLGTCISAFMASIGTKREARQVAIAQFLQKGIGVLIMMPFITPIAAWLHSLTPNDMARSIANASTFYNVALTLLLLPVSGAIAILTKKILPEKTPQPPYKIHFLEETLLFTPALAIEQARRETARMALIIEKQLKHAFLLFAQKEDTGLVKKIRKDDAKVDFLQSEISAFLNKILANRIGETQARAAEQVFFIAADLKIIGDIIVKNIVPLAENFWQKNTSFTRQGGKELASVQNAVLREFPRFVDALISGQPASFSNIQKNNERLHKKLEALRHSHLQRLIEGRRSALQTSTIHLDLTSYIKSIADRIASISRYHYAGGGVL